MIVPEPHRNPTLLGHDAAIEQIVATYQSSRMPQAWLIHGIAGIGKATLAYHIANYVMSDGRNLPGKLNAEHPVARLISAEAHPDLFVLQRPIDDKTGERKDSIAVEDARKIAPFLHRTATQGGWRVAIIDEAHTLNRHGQNAILKVIEEPPPRCLILITVTTPGSLLPTIRSRCRTLPLQPLANGTIRAILSRLSEGDEIDERIVDLAGGSVGFALKLLNSDSLPLYDEMMALIKGLPQWDLPKIQALADKISRKADVESFNVLTTLLVDFLRNNAKSLALADHGRVQLERALQVWEKVEQIFITADQANLDRKLAFINAMTEIRHAFA